MVRTITSVIIIFIFYANISYSQYIINNSNIKKELATKIFDDTIKNKEIKINTEGTNKSPFVSFFLSLLLPGAGHWYADRLDVGKYFLASEAACWFGVVGLNLYGNSIRDDSRSFASVHSGLNKSGKDDDYYSNVGNFANIYDYNNDKLQKGQYDKLYDVNSYFWSWDNSNNMMTFDNQRKKSERVYNDRIIFGTGLIVNRLISGISALILTNKGNNSRSSGSIHINSELIKTNNKYDGLRLNFVKTF
jgi:hypothetical protein